MHVVTYLGWHWHCSDESHVIAESLSLKLAAHSGVNFGVQHVRNTASNARLCRNRIVAQANLACAPVRMSGTDPRQLFAELARFLELSK